MKKLLGMLIIIACTAYRLAQTVFTVIALHILFGLYVAIGFVVLFIIAEVLGLTSLNRKVGAK